MRKLLICGCFNMKTKASEAFSMMFPGEVLPDIVKGRDSISKFAKATGNDHITAISKLSGRFAYFVELDENNKIVREYDLLKGKRIA